MQVLFIYVIYLSAFICAAQKKQLVFGQVQYIDIKLFVITTKVF